VVMGRGRKKMRRKEKGGGGGEGKKVTSIGNRVCECKEDGERE